MQAAPYRMPEPQSPGQPAVVAQFMSSVYRWMAVALVLTGTIAALVAANTDLMFWLARSGMFKMLWIAQLIMVVVFARSVATASYGTVLAMFLAYCGLTGISMSVLFWAFQLGSIAIALYVTGGAFAAMSAFGTLTKKDLSGMGRILGFVVIGLMIAIPLNMLLGWDPRNMIISAVALPAFILLTAYHTQRLRQMALSGDRRLALYGALTLYIDFLNILISVLNLFGRRR